MNDVLDYLYSADGKRRVAMFRGPCDSVGYVEEYWYRNELAGLEGWAQLQVGNSYYADLDTARRELPYALAFPIVRAGDGQ